MTTVPSPLADGYLPGPTFSNVDPALKQFWHPVALESDLLDGSPRQVWLLGVPWVLARLDGELAAMLDRCPHRLVPLSQGRVVGARLQCRYHGFEYDSSGACQHIPALGPDGVVPARIRVQTARVRVRFGLVWLSVTADPTDNDLDETAFLNPDLDQFVAGPFTTPVGAALLTDNFLDLTHLPFLHTQTFGALSTPCPTVKAQREGWSIRQTTESITMERGEAAGVLYEYALRAPFTVELKMTYLSGPDAGQSDYVWSFCQPEAAERTTWYMIQAYAGLGHDPAKITASAQFQAAVGREDLAILESMPIPQLPLDRHAEVHTRADAGCVSYRTIMREVASGARAPTSTASCGGGPGSGSARRPALRPGQRSATPRTAAP